jgi:hypothetical protein
MRLFRNLIGWRGNKQDTFATSTTEAELLALSQAAKEGQYISRLLKELTLDDHRIEIQCDNVQTIPKKSRNCKRSFGTSMYTTIGGDRKLVEVEYTKFQDMIADGPTKVLPTETSLSFQQQ